MKKVTIDVRFSYHTYDDYTHSEIESEIKEDIAEVLGLDETDIDVEVEE